MKRVFTFLISIITVLGFSVGSANAQYCTSGATSSADSDLTFVELVGSSVTISNNTNGLCGMYDDFTALPAANLMPGQSYDVTVGAGTCSYTGNKYAKVFIDWNGDLDFDDAGEEVGGGGPIYAPGNLVFNFTVPMTASIGTTRMRVVVVETYTLTNVYACGGYTWGGTEDYSVSVLPLSDTDAGVSAILAPTNIEDEAASIPVEVVVTNFGTLTMAASSVSYSLDGGTPVTATWLGLLAQGESDTFTMANLVIPAGNHDLCAWTTLVGDTIPQDDTTCMSFFGIPLWDAGVTAILTPGALELENNVVAPEVTVENFGADTITAMDIVYTVNSGTPVSMAWTGSLLPGTSQNVVLPTFIVPGGNDTICAWTDLVSDYDATNDETCFEFYADPQFDFAAFSFLGPVSYCSMGMEDVIVQYINQGDTTIVFDMAYSANGATAVVEAVNDTVFPGDTLTYTFTTQIDMSTTTVDVLYNFEVWCIVPNDPLFNNDTIFAEVIAMHTPEDPITQNDTIVYGTTADLISFSIDTVNWFDVDTAGAPVIATGNYFTTPVLLDTTTYWTQAATGSQEAGELTTTFAAGNGSSGNMFDITAINTIMIDSFYVNASGSTNFEVWYRPGSYVGFTSSNAGWTQLGSYYVTNPGTNIPASLPIGGLEIPAGETYGIYVTGSVSYTNGNGSNQYYSNADLEWTGGHGGSYFGLTFFPRVWNGTIFYTAGVTGCTSNLVPVTAIVTDIPTQDAGAVGLVAPIDGVELSTTETVTAEVYNYGLEEISGVSVSFAVNGTVIATEVITDTIQPYDTYVYTFTATADLSNVQTHQIEVCTSHPSDIYSFNDCMTFPVICFPLTYCLDSYPLYDNYEKIVNVTFSNINNTTLPTGTDDYSDFTMLAPGLLSPGLTYDLSVSSDFSVYTYTYACWVEVYIDWNHDGIFDETSDELVMSVPTTTQNTVTGTVTVPIGASMGTHGMRVVLDQSTTAAAVEPCGTYSYGETEDYLVSVLPWIAQDGGVTGFTTPGPIEIENMSIPVELTVQNFGSDTLTAFDIAVEFNGGAPVITPWAGVLNPGDVTNVVVSSIVPVGAVNTICAYTIVTGDTNPGNDETCYTFATSAQYDGAVTSLVYPENPGCGLGLEDVTIRIHNYGDTINGNMLTYIDFNGTVLSGIMSGTILPGDSLDFTFPTQYDFTPPTTVSEFPYFAYLNLLGDPNQANDTIYGSVQSIVVPAPPLGYDDTVPYGSTATLTCFSTASTYWYDVPVGGNFISADTFVVTPILFDTITYYVESSGGALDYFQIGLDNNVSGTSSYPNPYQTWYYGNREQFLVLAEELTAAGIAAGPINSIQFNAITVAPMNMANFAIKMGHSNISNLTGWQTGLVEHWFDASYVNTPGWNEHVFTTPFLWDGVSNIIIETCFNNGSYQSGAQCEYSVTPFTSTYVYRADNSSVCSSTSQSYNDSNRPNMKFNAIGPGCPSSRVAVQGIPTPIPAYDAGIVDISAPIAYGIDLAMEPVTVTIQNWGVNPIANFPVSYTVNGGTPVTETVGWNINSGDTYTYTFTAPVDMSAYGFYEICAYTGVFGDGWAANDTLCFTAQNDSVHYCPSYATGTYGEDIVNVTVGGWSNSSAPLLGGYQDFTGVTPATLTMNNSYPISITTDFAPGSSYSYTDYVEVYIDYNHDNVFSEPDEIAFGALTSSQNTVTGTITIPAGTYIGEVGMRVVCDGVYTAAEVTPCGTYYHGETEDYMVELGAQIPYDAGVISILQPLNNAMENYPSPVEVIVQNFGTEILTSFDILYAVDGGTPVPFNWTGSLAPGTTDNYFLPNLIIPGGYYDLCAYTAVTGDINTFNDETCINLYGIPQFEAAMWEMTAPEGGCDLNTEAVTIIAYNIADTVPVGNMVFAYQANGATPVTETYGSIIYPGDTITYTFNTLLDMFVTVDTDFEILAWVDLLGDPIQTDDTISTTVISYLTPVTPTAVDQTIWSGQMAELTVIPVDTNLNYFWYDSIGGTLVNNGPVFTTPNLFDTTTYVVQASSATFGDIQLGTQNNITSGTQYPSPYCTYWWGNRNQFLILASEMVALGFDAGQINSLAFNTITPAPMTMTNFTMSIGMTTASSITTWENVPMTQVFFDASYQDVVGWNIHEFTAAFVWDGVSNIIVETCFNNSSYTSGSQIQYSNVGFNASVNYHMDATGICSNSNTSFITNSQRPNMMLNVMIPGCSAGWVDVTANVEYPDYDAWLWDFTSPTSGSYLGLEDVTAEVYNNGLYSISNVPISYTVDGGTAVTESIVGPLLPGDFITYTFTQQADLALFDTFNICVYTGLVGDWVTSNDTACIEVINFEGDGLTCLTAYPYTYINDPVVYGATTYAYDAEWWSFELIGNYTNVVVSLCSSGYDTKLDVYSDCGSFYIGYNDDYCGAQSQLNFSTMSAGTYYAKVYGYSSSFGNYQLNITGDLDDPFAVQGTVSDVSCNGGSDGAIDVTVTNFVGIPPFTYVWSTTDVTEDISGLVAGFYEVTVFDSAGDSVVNNWTITEPSEVLVSLFGLPVTTIGGNDGSIDLWVTGGVGPYDFDWSNGEVTEDLLGIYGGYYTVTVTDANGCQVIESLLIEAPLPPGWTPTITTEYHLIDIPENAVIDLDAMALPYGSYIGVFYDAGGMTACGGVAIWSGMNTQLVAFGEQIGMNNGFEVAETFAWKVWDVSPTMYGEYAASAVYNTMYPNEDLFAIGGLSGIFELHALSIQTQTVELPVGWSFWSTYIYPTTPDIEDVMSAIVAQSHVIIVKDAYGNVFWPSWGIDFINDLTMGDGYQVKTTQATAFDVSGMAVVPELLPLTIGNGWSILGYLRTSPADIEVMLVDLTINTNLIIAKDYLGNIYWPLYNVNFIGNMLPGDGYQIKMDGSATLTYPANSAPIAAGSKGFSPEPVYFNDIQNTGNNMSIGIPVDSWTEAPNVGDEIGVFNPGGELIGSGVFNNEFTAITVWGYEVLNTEDITSGQELTIKLWDNTTSTEKVMIVEKWESGNGQYEKDAISIVGSISISDSNDSFALYQNMPNPFKESTEIKFYIPVASDVTISVYNTLGEKLVEVVSNNFDAGEHTVVFDANHLPSGNYFYKMVTDEFVSTKPMNINR